VKSGVDKFYQIELNTVLNENNVKKVIIVGTSAHGAVLHTATGAVQRNPEVIVPIDGISSDEPYAEQYTVWHLANAPGTRG
jgi:nicotinamidase-related amidase